MTGPFSTRSPITVGTHVEFDSDHGPQAGTVIDFMPAGPNGQRLAAIAIDHDLEGIVWTMPVTSLQKTQPTPRRAFQLPAMTANNARTTCF
ncbi:hypothetical protein AAKU55_005601 [Oxalobacteraceae bacterium GrIS 1.11]